MSDERKLEDLFKELDSIVETLDNDTIPLEESFKLYEKGVGLIGLCNTKIDKIEKDISVLNGGE